VTIKTQLCKKTPLQSLNRPTNVFLLLRNALKPERSMKTRTLAVVAALAGGILLSDHALAFTVDEKSGTNPDGSARYVDPDEQPLPFPFLVPSRPTDASEYQSDSSRYDPPPDRNGQWLRLPDWFSSPPRR
jgi:hypothetical protein